MSTDDGELPDGWSRIEDSDEQSGQYSPQQPIRYQSESIEVHVQPTANATDARDIWRLGTVRLDGSEGTETISDGIEGRDTAIETAREFMTTYNERCIEGNESTEDVILSF